LLNGLIENYNPSHGSNIGRLIIYNAANKQPLINLAHTGTATEIDLSTYVPVGAKAVLLNVRASQSASDTRAGIMIWPADDTPVTWEDVDIFIWDAEYNHTNVDGHLHVDSLTTRLSSDYKIKYKMSSTVGGSESSTHDAVIQVRGYYI